MERAPALLLVLLLLPVVQPHDDHAKEEHGADHCRCDPWDPVARVQEELGAPLGCACLHIRVRLRAQRPGRVDDHLRVRDERLEVVRVAWRQERSANDEVLWSAMCAGK